MRSGTPPEQDRGNHSEMAVAVALRKASKKGKPGEAMTSSQKVSQHDPAQNRLAEGRLVKLPQRDPK